MTNMVTIRNFKVTSQQLTQFVFTLFTKTEAVAMLRRLAMGISPISCAEEKRQLGRPRRR
jgi:hypothetical protein